MALVEIFDVAVESMAPVWVELSFLLFFTLGFIFLRKDTFRRQGAKKVSSTQGIRVRAAMPVRADAKWKKSLDAAMTAGNSHVLAAWRAEQANMPTPKDLMKPVIQAFLDSEPDALIPAMMGHLREHKDSLMNCWTATSILETIARAGHVKLMEELWVRFSHEPSISKNAAMFEVVLGGFASAGQAQKVEEYKTMLRASKLKLSPRGYSLIIKGFLKNTMVNEVLAKILEMTKDGQQVPAFAVAQFLRVSADAGKTAEVYKELIDNQIPIQSDAITVILEGCSRQKDPKMVRLAKQVELDARASQVEFSLQAYDALLKIYAQDCDQRVFDTFREMKLNGHTISEGLCVGLLARCADGKFLSFAEEVIRFVREGPGMSIALYSALMKVYAYSGMYDKACDLYEKIREDGLEPDSMMYGCLMKFSVECGRTKLSQELSEKVSVLDIQNYMSLIRAAGRDRDVDRAFAVIKRLKDNGVTPDAIAFNCVVDVCVKAGDMKRARELVDEMKEHGLVDIITYNTLLKGYVNSQNLPAAKALLAEMSKQGLEPNDVSFNCLLNSAACSGNVNDAWQIVEQMKSSNVKPDHYTVSILFKAIKHEKGTRNIQKCLDFLDASGVNPTSDEILLNTVLETYIRHKETRRLEALLANFEWSHLRPSVPTYGSIIKAYAHVKRVDKCWHYWDEMQCQRGLEPNDIVWGCMLDALVVNQRVDDAIDLFNNAKLKPNAVICSILVKGLASIQQPGRAMALWRDMVNQGMKMNTVAYNAIVDAQARLGNMDEVMEIVAHMAKERCPSDAITHSTIVKGYAVKGDLDKAMEVLKGMQDGHVRHDAIVYNTILDGCCKHKRTDLVDVVLKSMDDHKIVPTNFTLGILVKLYGRYKQLDKAFEAMEVLPQKGKFTPNSQVWSCIIGACIHNGYADEAVQAFKDMRAAGQTVDTRACTTLVSGLVRLKRLEPAVEMVDAVYGLQAQPRLHGASVDQDCLESLLAALAQNDLQQELGTPLLERLRKCKVPVSGRLMASALSHMAEMPRVLPKPANQARGKLSPEAAFLEKKLQGKKA